MRIKLQMFFLIFIIFKNFLKKTNKNINIKLLLQDTGETHQNLIEISNKILHELNNFKINDNEANIDIKSNIDNDNENNNDLI